MDQTYKSLRHSKRRKGTKSRRFKSQENIENHKYIGREGGEHLEKSECKAHGWQKQDEQIEVRT